MRKICCFAGHSNIGYSEKIQKQVYDKAHELAVNFGVKEFWVGNYGGAYKTLEHARRKKHIKIFNLGDLVVQY